MDVMLGVHGERGETLAMNFEQGDGRPPAMKVAEIKGAKGDGNCFYRAVYKSAQEQDLAHDVLSCVGQDYEWFGNEADFVRRLRVGLAAVARTSPVFAQFINAIRDAQYDWNATVQGLTGGGGWLATAFKSVPAVNELRNKFAAAVVKDAEWAGYLETRVLGHELRKCGMRLRVISKDDFAQHPQLASNVAFWRDQVRRKTITVAYYGIHYDYVSLSPIALRPSSPPRRRSPPPPPKPSAPPTRNYMVNTDVEWDEYSAVNIDDGSLRMHVATVTDAIAGNDSFYSAIFRSAQELGLVGKVLHCFDIKDAAEHLEERRFIKAVRTHLVKYIKHPDFKWRDVLDGCVLPTVRMAVDDSLQENAQEFYANLERVLLNDRAMVIQLELVGYVLKQCGLRLRVMTSANFKRNPHLTSIVGFWQDQARRKTITVVQDSFEYKYVSLDTLILGGGRRRRRFARSPSATTARRRLTRRR